MEVPIACSLSPGEARDRVEEWRRLFATSIEAAETVGADLLKLRLAPSTGVVEQVVDLARREKSCCPFFDFSIAVEPAGSWLVVGVPTAAEPVLRDFAALVPEALRTGT